MNRTISILRMHNRDNMMWLLLPWMILLSSFAAVNIIVSFLVKVEDGIYSGGMSSIIIYMLGAGIVSLTQSFPFALGLSIRRTDFFWGTTLMSILVSTITATFLLLLSVMESEWTSFWGVNLHFFKLPYLNDGNAAMD